MSTNKLRNMTAEESIELLEKLVSIFEERTYFGYNSSLINPFTEQLTIIKNVMANFKPNDDSNILDIHGISILNSILKVNAISERFTLKFFSNALKYEDEEESEYKTLIESADAEFIEFSNSKGYVGEDELVRVKKLLSDFSTGPVRIRPVKITENGSEENITEAFDYHLLVYLTKCLEIENIIYKSKYEKYRQARVYVQFDDQLRKRFHTAYFNDVSSCRSSCVGLCAASCDTTCYGCGGGCAGQCTEECADCSKSCVSTCSTDCVGGCKGCNGCSNSCDGCTNSCSADCGSNCTNGCGDCAGSCFGTTTGAVITCGCGGQCTTDCSTDCTGNSGAPTKISVDDPPVVIEPDTIPSPEDIQPHPSPNIPSHPTGGWVTDGDGTGHWEVHVGGETYRTDTMSTIGNGASNSGSSYKTPWGANSPNNYYQK